MATENKTRKVVGSVIRRFKLYNPKLTVIRIIQYRFIFIVIAVYNIENGLREMDSLYLYYPLTGKVSVFCPTENIRRFGRMQQHGKIIYDVTTEGQDK